MAPNTLTTLPWPRDLMTNGPAALSSTGDIYSDGHLLDNEREALIMHGGQ